MLGAVPKRLLSLLRSPGCCLGPWQSECDHVRPPASAVAIGGNYVCATLLHVSRNARGGAAAAWHAGTGACTGRRHDRVEARLPPSATTTRREPGAGRP